MLSQADLSKISFESDILNSNFSILHFLAPIQFDVYRDDICYLIISANKNLLLIVEQYALIDAK